MMKYLFSLFAFSLLCHTGSAIPKELSRFGRSWEAEACSSRNLRNQDRYICTQDGKIKCLDGWIGDLCQVPMCGNDCDPQHGYCIMPGECKCNLGYHGPSCRDCVKLPGCQNGYCKKSFECRCEEGWSGMFCNTPVCDEDCEKNNGFCSGPRKCECKRGYSGEKCSECKTLPGCVNGSCKKPLECICDEGWTGTFCNQPICSEDCSKEFGTCFKPGECRCKVGFQGEGCAQCVPYPGCVNGDCKVPYDCNCKKGWKGPLCESPEVSVFGSGPRPGRCQPLESFVCMNGGLDTCTYYGNGTMVGQPSCKCKPGFSGTWCEVAEKLKSKDIQVQEKQTIEPRNSATSNAKKHSSKNTHNKRKDINRNNKEEKKEVANKNNEKDIGDAHVKSKKTEEKEEKEKSKSTKTERNNDEKEKSEASNDKKGPKESDKMEDFDVESENGTEVRDEDDADIANTETRLDPDENSEAPNESMVSKNKSDENNQEEVESEDPDSVTQDSDRSIEEASELGVRAIHTDVFNSGKLIENFEGLQSFEHFK